MADTKRVTPADQADAYRKTGMGIALGSFIACGGAFGCGMGVYAVANLGVDPREEYAGMTAGEAIKEAGFSLDYQTGFSVGFDGKSISTFSDTGQDYILGYEDGRAAYAAAKDVVNG